MDSGGSEPENDTPCTKKTKAIEAIQGADARTLFTDEADALEFKHQLAGTRLSSAEVERHPVCMDVDSYIEYSGDTCVSHWFGSLL